MCFAQKRTTRRGRSTSRAPAPAVPPRRERSARTEAVQVRRAGRPLPLGGGGRDRSRFESVSCSVERDACADRRCIVAFRASNCCTTDDSSRWTWRTSFTRSALDIRACNCARVASKVEARAALSTYSPVTSLTRSVVSSTSVDFVRPPIDFRKSLSREAVSYTHLTLPTKA